MASHDESYKAGEAKGRTQEKSGEMMENVKEKAVSAKDSVYDATQSAMAKGGGYMESAKQKASETAEAAKQKVTETTQSARDTAQGGKDEKTGPGPGPGGVLQATGEKVMGMAQGATDAVKHTLGMAGSNDDPTARRD